MLSDGPEFPHDTFEREMHINEQSAPRLGPRSSATASACGAPSSGSRRPQHGYFDSRRLNLELKLLDFVRFLRPLSYHPPLNRYFCNHIWMVAERT